MHRFLRLLEAQDFRRVWPAQIGRNFEQTEKQLLFQAAAGRAIFSVRWRLPGRTSGAHSLAEIWRRRELGVSGGQSAFVPCPTDCVLLNVMLGSENHWRHLSNLLATCESARRLEAHQWKCLLADAASEGVRRNLLLGLELAAEVGQIHLPDTVRSAVRRSDLRGRAPALLDSLFDLRSGAGTLYDLRWDLGLMDSTGRSARYLIRFLFTPTVADAGFGAPLGALLRPLRLLRALVGIPVRRAREEMVSQAENLSAYRPSEFNAVDKMLELAKIAQQDVVFDLGCGDGRILIRAAEKCGARGVGIDLDPQRIAEASRNARTRGVQHLVHFRVGCLQQQEICEATALMLYLPPAVHLELGATLVRRLRPGARVVSYGSDTGVWERAEVVERAGYPMVIFLRTIVGHS